MSFVIERAKPSDAHLMGFIHATAWHETYTGIVLTEHLAKITPEKRSKFFEAAIMSDDFEQYICRLNGEAAGILEIGKSRDTDAENTGEIGGLYFVAKYHGNGLGKKTIAFAINRLKQQGYTKVTLWVLEENTNARGFYEKVDFCFNGTVKEITLGKTLNELRYELNI